MIHEAIHTLLNSVTRENYPNKFPQGKPGDYVVYRILGTDPSNTKSDLSHADFLHLIIDVYSDVLADAEILAESVRTELDYYSGTVGTVEITSIIFQDQSDDLDFNSDKHNIRQDYRLRFKR